MNGSVAGKIGAYLMVGVAWVVFSAAPAFPQQMGQGRWMEQAEQTFGMGRGLGRQLMTQEEWRNHQRTMQGMSPGERQTYRNEWHKKLQERAREKGVSMPDTPGWGRGGQEAVPAWVADPEWAEEEWAAAAGKTVTPQSVKRDARREIRASFFITPS